MSPQHGPPPDWPHAAFSHKIRGPVHDWHVQDMGSGPTLLLLHGAGGSAHSFGAMMPIFAENYRVIAPDLPGHGFTRLGAQRRSGLPQMTEDVLSLCAAMDAPPDAVIGHSAGAAIALGMAQKMPNVPVIGINPALGHFEGLAGVIFPAVAKMLAAVPFTGRIFSNASARPHRIKSLLEGTGSRLTPEGLELYRQLVASEAHVNGALAMMAQWSLDDLLRDLPEISASTLFIVGENDRTVPAKVAMQAAARMPNAAVTSLAGYGHLVHEEAPEHVARLCLDFLTTN